MLETQTEFERQKTGFSDPYTDYEKDSNSFGWTGLEGLNYGHAIHGKKTLNFLNQYSSPISTYFSKTKTEELYELMIFLRNLELHENDPKMACATVCKLSARNAYVVANMWPENIRTPVLDIDDEGIISLFIFDENESSLAEIEFCCDDKIASYSILHRSKKDADCGFINSTAEFLKFFSDFESRWGDIFSSD